MMFIQSIRKNLILVKISKISIFNGAKNCVDVSRGSYNPSENWIFSKIGK